ncbi:hypothetical protein [Rathayibacter toxicus]|uniref:Glycosyltransferase RgtA/B/C/D-like domain-containing protein n=1 Tax=Rathayibacter toxicus TaxID=145458 RepID=A0A0C5BTP4_9MICO|nr:hypothetical protein [Rathayibacter toxicus]AJM78017.1 hypothetical protein TI83_08830 [Rathayibacter toxicus]ALS57757.1 hypothetical protein APU90_08245 [Rathayibacter toxicus]KKM47337.1 hypothetical protein VT73_00355 [Rathayibacter toxicus]PPG20571.1 hypothetical protein C5D15_08675 [Rathayibacter toxicus]PPG45673.1 hypothetical protein C5D16_08645 [Rathayibacter toxicus]
MIALIAQRLQWRRILLEILPVVVVVAGALIVLAQMSSTLWSTNLLYNGDSLVLPLVYRSIVAGEPFDWVFSSQLFLFPEMLIYSIIAFIVNDPRLAILVNGIVNIFILYLFFRIISRVSLGRLRRQLLEISVSLGMVGLFLFFCVLEPHPDINGSTVASLYFFNTYYQGIIIVGLAVVALTIWIFRGFRRAFCGGTRAVGYSIAAGLTTFAVVLCDPLYLLQVTVPLVLTLVVMWFARYLSPRGFVLLLGVNLGAALLGVWARRFVTQFLAVDVDRYIDSNNIPASIELLSSTLTKMLTTQDGQLKMILWGGVVIFTVFFFVYALFVQNRPALRRTVSGTEFFLTAFSTMSLLTMLVGFVATGSLTTRYLLPLFIFPLLAAIPVIIRLLRLVMVNLPSSRYRLAARRCGRSISAAVVIMVIVLGAVSTPPVVTVARGDDYVGARCFNEIVGNRQESGVGSFWITRQWEVYGAHRGDVLQVQQDLSVYPWMINLSSYTGKRFSYVIVDQWGFVSKQSIESLGKPAAATVCGDFTIYDYAGTPGEEILTQKVESSVAAKMARRGFTSPSPR